jgi:hypothetical protein
MILTVACHDSSSLSIFKVRLLPRSRDSDRPYWLFREPALAEGNHLSESGGRHRFRACCYDPHEPAQ